jgi:hypothetical protein
MSDFRHVAHLALHQANHFAYEGSHKGPMTTRAGMAAGLLGGAVVVATGGLAIPAALGTLAATSYLGYLGGGSLAHVTKK